MFHNIFLKLAMVLAQPNPCSILSAQSKPQPMIFLIIISWVKVDLGWFTRYVDINITTTSMEKVWCNKFNI